jgi:hypothetical protein
VKSAAQIRHGRVWVTTAPDVQVLPFGVAAGSAHFIGLFAPSNGGDRSVDDRGIEVIHRENIGLRSGLGLGTMRALVLLFC